MLPKIKSADLLPTVLALAATVLSWTVLVEFVVPAVIGAAYARTSLPSVNALITGQAEHPLDYYVHKGKRIAWAMLPPAVLLMVVVARSRRRRDVLTLIVLLGVAAFARAPGILERAIWEDEAVSLLETAGHSLPAWPHEPVRAGTLKVVFEGNPTLGQVAADLRNTDVHPPLYYWILTLWRRALGFSLESARALSLVCSIAAVFALFLLLRAAGAEYPLVGTLVYAFSSDAVLFGAVARNYAVASLCVLLSALLAWLGVERAGANGRGAAALLAGAGVFCGLAFQTHYLALFPVAVILLWAVLYVWPIRRSWVVIAPVAALAVALPAVRNLVSKQMGARPAQAAGFAGVFQELVNLLKVNLTAFWQPVVTSNALHYAVAALALVLIATGTWLAARRSGVFKAPFRPLLFGLALAPSAGVFALDFLFDKRLTDPQYLTFATPMLAVLISLPICRVLGPSFRGLGAALLAVVFGIQMVAINWGFEEGPLLTGRMRSAARAVAASRPESRIVVIDEGYGRGNPASAVYELEPDVNMVFFGSGSNLDAVWSQIERYRSLWFLMSPDEPTESQRRDLLERVEQAGSYVEVWRDGLARHLIRTR